MDGSENGELGALHWVEQALIEAWAAPSAPSKPIEGESPWYACYTPQNTNDGGGWKKATVDNKGDPTHGTIYYYNEALQSTQWERPDDYTSDNDECNKEEVGKKSGTTCEQLRTERWLSGDLDGHQEAINAVDRCIELLSARGDDAQALSIVMKSTLISPERLLSSRSSQGRPLLVEASKKGCATCVALLIDAYGADIDVVTSNDLCTSLHIAAFHGQSIVVETLLIRGASLTLLNKWNETAADAAHAQGREHCAMLIDEASNMTTQSSTALKVVGTDEGSGLDSLDEFDQLHNQLHSTVKLEEQRMVFKEAVANTKGLHVVVKQSGGIKVGTTFQFQLNEEDIVFDHGDGSDKANKVKKMQDRYEGKEGSAVVLLRLGRGSVNSAVLPEILVSKRHALIVWLSGSGNIAIRDEGSQHGLTVRGHKYKPPCRSQRNIGEWICLKVGDEFKIGNTVMSIEHFKSKPSVLISSFIPNVPNKRMLEATAEASVKLQKEVSKKLKIQATLEKETQRMEAESTARFKMPPPAPSIPLRDIESEDHVGRNMLSRMGWKQGEGLGKNQDGIHTAIQPIELAERAGLGCERSVRETQPVNQRRVDEWKKRMARYASVCDKT